MIFGATQSTLQQEWKAAVKPGKINISGTTYELVKDKFNCFTEEKFRQRIKERLICILWKQFHSTVAHPITSRLKEIKKRRALRGKQRVELLINSVGKRTVVLLNPSFFYFFNPFFVSRHVAATISQCRFFNRRCTLVYQRADKANFY